MQITKHKVAVIDYTLTDNEGNTLDQSSEGKFAYIHGIAPLVGFQDPVVATRRDRAVGLASIIRGRNPMIDGFGLIAFASLLPMIFVMGYGLLIFR